MLDDRGEGEFQRALSGDLGGLCSPGGSSGLGKGEVQNEIKIYIGNFYR